MLPRNLLHMLKTRCHRVLYGVLKVFVMWLSLKTLRSNVLASIATAFFTSLQAPEESDGFFQCEVCVQLPTTQLTRH